MADVVVRKRILTVEEILHERGPAPARPQKRASALAIIRNPFAGRYVEVIAPYMDDLKPLGLEMVQTLIAALGGDPRKIEGYGKGAIVGEDGELEHGAGGNRFLIDFNLAYNPYCAYNKMWSCPITPAENRLKVPIEAGDKIFHE